MFKRNKFYKVLAVILAILMLSISFGCDSNEEDANSGNNGVSVKGKVHVLNNEDYKDTNEYILRNGNSDFAIVLPEKPNTYELFAADELQLFFNQATGVKLPIYNEDKITYSDSSKYFLLGETDIAENKGVIPERDKTTTTGYKIKTIDKSIIVQGGAGDGTLYGVYDLMSALFNYKIYAADEIHVDKVSDLTLKNYNVVYKPTIENRQTYACEPLTDSTLAMRMKNILNVNLWAKIQGRFVHTSDFLVPSATYKATNPEWFGTDGHQLCYSEGLENEEMFNVLYTNLKAAIDVAPNAKYVSVSQWDVASWCGCDRCVAKKERYGSNLGVMIQFVNKVARKVKEDYPNRDLYIQTFSYHETSSAITAHFDEVMCEPNVTVMFAPIRANFTTGFTDVKNSSTLASLEAISRICSQVTIWTYDVHFPQPFMFYNTIGGRVDRYTEMEKNNVNFIFDENLSLGSGLTPSFSRLKCFLTANLSYDKSMDQVALIDDWFDNYFKDASIPMRNYFEELRAWSMYASEERGLSTDCNNGKFLSADCFDKGVLLGWMDYVEQAYDSIEYLKWTNYELYEKIHDRITLESLTIRYMLIELYGTSFSAGELKALQNNFKSDCTKVNISVASSGISDLYAKWGI